MTVDPLPLTNEAQLFSIDEVMQRLGVGRNTVFNLLGSGELRSVKLGRRRMVSAQALRDFIAALDQAGD
jgi:excisionase family DNA binding protein